MGTREEETVKQKPEWEGVTQCAHRNSYECTDRMRVPGGWIVREQSGGENEISVALCFVPDPNHEWEIEK